MRRVVTWVAESFVPLLVVFTACGLALVWAQVETMRRLSREVVIQVVDADLDALSDQNDPVAALLRPIWWQPGDLPLGATPQAVQDWRALVNAEPGSAGAWADLAASFLTHSDARSARTLKLDILDRLDVRAPPQQAFDVLAKTFGQRSSDDRLALSALLFNLGLAHHRLGELKAARRAYLVAEGVSTRWQVALGLALLGRDQGRKREQLLERAVERAPLSVRSSIALAVANLHLRDGDAHIAAKILRTLLASEPGNIPAQLSLAGIFAADGHHHEAERLYWAVLEQKPFHARAHHGLALLLEQQMRELEALRHLRQAVLYAPDFAEARRHLGLIFLQNNRLKQAAHHFEWLRQRFPDQAEHAFGLGKVRWLQARSDQAEALLQEAIAKRNGNYLEAWVLLGSVLKDAGRLAAAERAYLAALKLQPGAPEALHRLGRLYAATGRHRKAAKAYTRALASDEHKIEIWRDLGQSRVRQNQLEEAVTAYNHVILRRPDDVEGLMKLGEVLAKRGEDEEASRLYHRVLALDGDRAVAWLRLGQTRQRLLDTPGALEAFGNAARLASHDGGKKTRVAAYRAIALLHGYRHEYREALDNYRHVILHKPRDTDARFGAATVLRELGEQDAAWEEVNKLLAIDERHWKGWQLAVEVAKSREDEAGEAVARRRLEALHPGARTKPRARAR